MDCFLYDRDLHRERVQALKSHSKKVKKEIAKENNFRTH